jgi:regulator of protease activity HflC (stomatin/prohibitin superfamily)
VKDKVIALLFGLLKRPKVLLTIVGVILVWSSVKSCTAYVAPDEVGVKQVYFGSSPGMRKELLQPGLHLVTTGAERVHIFPTDLLVLEMSTGEGAKDHRTTGAIRIQTSEGYAVTLDATVLYRIADPYALITRVGPGKLYEDSIVVPRSDQILRKTLGELNAEEFYDPAKRVGRVHEAEEMLRADFAEKGLEVVKVLVRRVTYDRAYQSQIEQRKIQDQAVFKNQAEGKAAKEDAHKREIVASGQATFRVELEKGKSEAARLLADADLYARQKAAEADLLVKTANARGTELENAALNQAAGSQNMVGLKMAEALQGLRVIMLPSGGDGLNPMDLGSTLKKFDVK